MDSTFFSCITARSWLSWTHRARARLYFFTVWLMESSLVELERTLSMYSSAIFLSGLRFLLMTHSLRAVATSPSSKYTRPSRLRAMILPLLNFRLWRRLMTAPVRSLTPAFSSPSL